MAVVYKLDAAGGFTCGDTETRVTLYAYPSSETATKARKQPLVVATASLAGEAKYRTGNKIEADYDARHWAKLT